MLYVIEGLSRTGKTTLAAEIARRLGMSHDKSRPPAGSDIKSFVLGKSKVHQALDLSSVDIIMDRQLPSSYAYGKVYRDESMIDYRDADDATPTVYFWLGHSPSTAAINRIHKSTAKGEYHASTHSIDTIRELQNCLEQFFSGTKNPVIRIDLPDSPTQLDYDIAREQIIAHIVKLRPSWNRYFMLLAQQAQRRSTCLSRHVGAVLVKTNRVLGIGYSGPPAGAPHCTACARRDCDSGELLHDSRAVHAEVNAVLNATSLDTDMTMYCTTQPCRECTKMLINAGVVHIIYLEPYPDLERDALVASVPLTMELMDFD